MLAGGRSVREQIFLALKKFGGSARTADVVEEIGRQLEARLLPGDMEWREATKEYAWQNNAKWERHRMVQDSALRKDSSYGIWAPTDNAQ